MDNNKNFKPSPLFSHIAQRLEKFWQEKRAGFIGADRETFIKTLIGALLLSPDSEKQIKTHFILIEGEPGVGKSSVAAMLPGKFVFGDGRPAPMLISYAFSLSHSDINTLADFTEYVCGCLQRDYDVENMAGESDWRKRLKGCLLCAADSAIAGETGRIFLLIDGLEECPEYLELIKTLPRSNKIVYLLLAQPDVVQVVDGQNFYKTRLQLLARETAEQILRDRLIDKWDLAAKVVAKLLSHDDNLNPLILTEFAEEFLRHQSVDGVWWEDIRGLESYFRKRAAEFDALTGKLLGTLAWARENLTSNTLEGFVKVDNAVLRKSMSAASRFVALYSDAGGYQYRHNAWKTYARQEFNQSGLEFALWSGENALIGKNDDSGYSLRHGVAHFIEENKWKKADWEKAARLLTDFDYLMRRAKADAMDTIYNEYEAVGRNCHEPAFNDWLGFYREKSHLLWRGNKDWGAERILFQLAWEDGKDSVVSAAADKYEAEGKVNWERILSLRPKCKVRRNYSTIYPANTAMELKDGRILTLGGGPTPHIYDPVSCKCLVELADGGTNGIELKNGRVLTWGHGGHLRVWDADNGKCLINWIPYADSIVVDTIHLIKVTPPSPCGILELTDGRILTWCYRGDPLRIWNPADGECLLELEWNHPMIKSALELKDGKILLRDDYDVPVVWNTATGESFASPDGCPEFLYDAVRLRDGRMLMTGEGKAAGALRGTYIWDTDTDECLILDKRLQDGALELKDGIILTWQDIDKTISTWDPVTGKALAAANTEFGHFSGAFELKDGKVLLWDLFHVNIWDTTSGHMPVQFSGPTKELHGLIYLRDGRILSWGNDSTLRIWTAGNWGFEKKDDIFRLNGVLELKDTRILSWYSVGFEPYMHVLKICLHDMATVGQIDEVKNPPSVYKILMAMELGDGRVLVLGSGNPGLFPMPTPDKLKDYQTQISKDNGTISILNPTTKEWGALTGHTAQTNGAIELRDGKILTWSDDKTLRVWNTVTNECLITLEGHSGAVTGARELKNGKIISWSVDKTLRIWDIANGACVVEYKSDVGAVENAIELKDGEILLRAKGKTLSIWDISTGKCLKLKGHESEVINAINLKDGKILSWGHDKTLRIWNPLTGECLATLKHAYEIATVVDLHGDRFITSSLYDPLRVWDSAGKCILEFKGNRSVETAIELKDGRILISSWDNTLCIWDTVKNNISSVWHSDSHITRMFSKNAEFPLWGVIGKELIRLTLVPGAAKG